MKGGDVYYGDEESPGKKSEEDHKKEITIDPGIRKQLR